MVAAPPDADGEGSGSEPHLRRPVLLVTPYSLETNPYVRLLLDALRAEGERVEVARGRSPVLLWRAARRVGRPGVVHLQWHHPYLVDRTLVGSVARTATFLVQLLTLRLLGARIVWTVHNLLEHERRHPRWELAACRVLARVAHVLLAHCDTAALEVATAYRVPADSVRVVPHGPLPVTGAPDRERARRELGLADDAVFLLNFGRVRAYKGVDRLLDAFLAASAADGDRLRLMIAGYPDDPGLAGQLERRAAGDSRIRLRLEEVEDEELSRLITACDAVVLPYRHTLTSGAAILAATHGRPVIAPRLGCLREFPADGGILYEAADADGLARALADAVDAPLGAMGEAAGRLVEAAPWPLVGRRTTEAYHGTGSDDPGL